jgi:iron complex transport system permease protein
MRGSARRKRAILTALILLTFFSVPLSSWLGYYKASMTDVLRVLFMLDNSPSLTVVWNLRLRRILAAIIISAVLGGAGTAIQAVMRNPLASPFTFGLSFAASLGVAVALLILQGGALQRYQIYVYNPFMVAMCALAFLLVQVLVVLLLVYKAGLSAGSLVLSAIAISFAYQAVLYLLQYFYLNEILVSTVVFWTFGDLGRISWEELRLVAAASAFLVIPYSIYMGLDYDLILGEKSWPSPLA